MRHFLKPFLLAGSLTAGSAIGASAAILDFTDVGAGGTCGGSYTTCGPVATGNIGTVGWTLTAFGGPLNVFTEADVSDATGIPLELETDGVGIGSTGDSDRDEVTNDDETLLLSFSRSIRLTAVHVLDLFLGIGQDGQELALAYDEATSSVFVTVEASSVLGAADGGYKKSAPFGQYPVQNIRFSAGGSADYPTSTFDFALAAIEYASSDGQEPDPVPLPAGGLLLIGGLAALATARRRRK